MEEVNWTGPWSKTGIQIDEGEMSIKGQRMSISQPGLVRYHSLEFVIAPCAKYGRMSEVILCKVNSNWISSALKKLINVNLPYQQTKKEEKYDQKWQTIISRVYYLLHSPITFRRVLHRVVNTSISGSFGGPSWMLASTNSKEGHEKKLHIFSH